MSNSDIVMTIDETVDLFEDERMSVLKIFKKHGLDDIAIDSNTTHTVLKEMCVDADKLLTQYYNLSESYEVDGTCLVDKLECSVENSKELADRSEALFREIGQQQRKFIAAQTQKQYLIHEANELAQTIPPDNTDQFKIDRLRALVLILNHLGCEVGNQILMTLVLHLPPPKISLKSAQYNDVLLQIRFKQDLGECCSFYSACKSYLKFLQSGEKELNILEKELIAKDFDSAHHALKAAKKRMGL